MLLKSSAIIGGGLAVGSGDSYYRNIEVAAMLTG